MLLPQRRKFRKAFKGRIKGETKAGADFNFGIFGLKAMTAERINSRQIEAARKAITNYLKRSGKLWIRIFPDLPVSAKPADVRMGKGKGSVEYWAFRVAPGRIMFELDGVTEEMARGALERAAAKLPLKSKFVRKVEVISHGN